jgi:hypothetical protein
MMRTAATSDIQPAALEQLMRRVQAEYAEMPGLSMTLAQAQRLLALDRRLCETVFRVLVSRGVLRRTAQGRYIRA